MRGKTLSFLHIVQHTKMERGASRATFPRGAWERSIGRHQEEIGWLSGCLRGQASLLQWNVGTCKEIGRLSGRLRGQASLLQWNGGYLQEIGWLSGRLREQARSYSGMGIPARDWSAVRPPSRASLAPTRIQRTAFDSHHSSGRALARLQLLILIYPPLSGG